MNSYLDLVKEYAKKHKNKNRMSLFVILLAVALVATIFGMADMEMQTQQRSMKKQYGNWHINIRDISGGYGRAGRVSSGRKSRQYYGGG